MSDKPQPARFKVGDRVNRKGSTTVWIITASSYFSPRGWYYNLQRPGVKAWAYETDLEPYTKTD
jgi:hypothetical protein